MVGVRTREIAVWCGTSPISKPFRLPIGRMIMKLGSLRFIIRFQPTYIPETTIHFIEISGLDRVRFKGIHCIK